MVRQGGHDKAHAALCVRAVRWLQLSESRQGPGCTIAVSECQAADAGEIPDAIGFRAVGQELHSVVVEVKVSRADFLADAKKPHRQEPAAGMGQFRYYLAPAGLIRPDELPPRWGLIEVDGRALRVRAGHVLAPRLPEKSYQRDFTPWSLASNRERELALMVRLFARVGDADLLHRQLKEARNRLAYAARTAEHYRDRATAAERNNFVLRCALDEHAIPHPTLERLPKSLPRRASAASNGQAYLERSTAHGV
ncbi:hypothetical protein A2G96_12820 [Cupriavidus nantongensis]|uniref:Adenylosuccinate synthase n=1 Tax=Cupriavidus nantongensis TaxID=1796606 RepID=A0A142JKD9_9BURK|nr:hypothetical protein A2G96_12820 [Cupriavidus nantongensis]